MGLFVLDPDHWMPFYFSVEVYHDLVDPYNVAVYKLISDLMASVEAQ